MGARLAYDNPWWASGEPDLEQFGDLRERRYLAPLYQLVAQEDVRRAVVLMGPRRVGKTVMLHQCISRLLGSGVDGRSILYASVDTPMYVGRSLEGLLRLFQERMGLEPRAPAYVFYDEIQYHPDWERHLKSLVDSYPAIQFVASGSAAAALRVKSRESGAGRFTDFLLPPLTFAEFLEFVDAAEGPSIEALNELFVDYVNYGGFPEAVLNPVVRSDPGRYLRGDVIEKVLLRDLPSLYGIDDVQELYRLFTVLALNTAQEVSLAALSKDSGVQQKTLRRYLEYLEAAFLIWVVPRVDGTGTRYKRRTQFKVHLASPSMRTALLGPVGGDEADFGHLAETAILAEALPNVSLYELSYARWKKGRKWLEVDVVSRRPDGEISSLFEIKWSDRAFHDPRGLLGLATMAADRGLGTVIATTRTAAGEGELGGVPIRYVPTSVAACRLGLANLEFRERTGLFGHLATRLDDPTDTGPAD